MEPVLLDAAGRRRSPVTLPGYHRGRPPRNKGLRYPADPPTIEEIVAVMRRAGDRPDGLRMRGLIVVLWRACLRINEALALAESDLDPARGAILVRRGKGGKRREVGMDPWAWDQLAPWLRLRRTLPVGALFCVIHGPTQSRPWSAPAARQQARRITARRRAPPLRTTPTALRPRRRDGQRGRTARGHPRQLGHANLGITSVYLQGIDNAEIIDTVHARRPP
jgi:integrase